MLNWVFFFTFLMCVKVSANGYSQGVKVSLDFKDTELRKALSVLQQKGKVRFLYSEELLPAHRDVTLQVKDAAVLDVLGKILKNTGLQYKLINNILVVITT